MLDPKLLRQNLDAVVSGLNKRSFSLDIKFWKSSEEKRKFLQLGTEKLRAQRNQKSKEIGLSKAKGADTQVMQEAVSAINLELKQKADELELLSEKIEEFLQRIPNIPHESVPYGSSDQDNKVIDSFGEPRRFEFEPRGHMDLGGLESDIDFVNAAKISGSRFVILKGDIAKLQRSLIQFMLDLHVEQHGYKEIYVPFLVNRDALIGTGQLPKFKEDLFSIENDRFFLIPTAEVPVTSMLMNEIVEECLLPLKFACHTPCFRSEAGSYGRDVKGMIRQHQFEKVELVQFVKPEDSYGALESLTSHAETVLKKLELPFRKVLLCSGDMGFSAAKTYDLEVWLPSQSKYREISSCSNFENFQARRLKARMRSDKGGIELLHTINGSGVAAGRALIAILENNQQKDGSVLVPKVLQPYMGGKTQILNV
ncbi:MAG: serine--tRNA ligase [Methylococcaceae bacterium TMED69]|nr:MAG: serine--tRNA ligase [Methylococcaceae bacterium TMED69]|tara:strand:- start:3592 stop:4866 length:1275 start_codon:yes stop_codon:yes gene_type:complete